MSTTECRKETLFDSPASPTHLGGPASPASAKPQRDGPTHLDRPASPSRLGGPSFSTAQCKSTTITDTPRGPMEGDMWPQARSRRHDPASSREAADKLNRSGTTRIQQMLCLRGLRVMHGVNKTAAELYEIICRLWPAEVEPFLMASSRTGLFTHKRLPELRNMGLAANGPRRKCQVLKSMCQTWVASPMWRPPC